MTQKTDGDFVITAGAWLPSLVSFTPVPIPKYHAHFYLDQIPAEDGLFKELDHLLHLEHDYRKENGQWMTPEERLERIVFIVKNRLMPFLKSFHSNMFMEKQRQHWYGMSRELYEAVYSSSQLKTGDAPD